MAKLPAEAATATLLLLALLLSPATGVRAARRGAAERDAGHPLAAGARRRAQSWPAGAAAAEAAGGHLRRAATARTCRQEIAALGQAGKTEDEVLPHFVTQEGGQHVLRSRSTGFGRFAWVIPYGVGASGLVLVGVAAIRWSRRREHGDRADDAGFRDAPSDLQSRLDDELRDLD